VKQFQDAGAGEAGAHLPFLSCRLIQVGESLFKSSAVAIGQPRMIVGVDPPGIQPEGFGEIRERQVEHAATSIESPRST